MAPPSVEYADWFKSQHIDVKKKWLDDILVKNSSEIQRMSGLSSVRQLLFEEWKNTKITETTSGTIPNTNQSQPIGILNTFHVIEVLKYSNVAVSSHSQLRKFNENDNFDGDETEEGGGDWGGGFNFSAKGKTKYGQAKSSRCWELICSDGKSTIYATELESLHLELSEIPGLKLLLKPPISTSKGVLLLKNNNVTVIGGKYIEEPQKSILLAHLESRYIESGGTPPERKKADQSKLKALTTDESTQKKVTQKIDYSTTKGKAPTKPAGNTFWATKSTSNSDIRSFFDKKEPPKQTVNSTVSTPEPTTKPGDGNSDFESDDDDDFYAALAAVNAKKAEKKAQNYAIEQNTQKDDDEWSDDDDSLFIEAIKATKSTSKSVSKSPQPITTDNSMDDSVIILDSPPPQKKMVKSVPYSTKTKQKSSDWSFLCSIDSFPSRNRIIIQGFIVTLAGKIQLNTAGITVRARVGDGTGTKEALILHEAMEILFEHKFDRQNLSSEKKTIQKFGKRAQQNIYDFFGKIELIRGDHPSSSSSSLSNDEWGIIKLERIS